jgi:predicted polyphosphate/ATP-dependent NAD kinase
VSTRNQSKEIVVGLIANPASGRDIRRLTAKASVFPLAEKANMIQRLLGPLGLLGVDRVLMMPDATGIAAQVVRAIETHHAQQLPPWPRVEFVNMPITGGAGDSERAARAMADSGARPVVVLGGDGTHRVVAAAAPDLPLATLSSGTNNVFPDLREATVTGLAAALFATGMVAGEVALRRNKILRVRAGAWVETALVDVCFNRLAQVGARAVWEADAITELFVSFAEPDAIGLSAIAAMVRPTLRYAPRGVHVRCDPAAPHVLVALAPGVIRPIGIARAEAMAPGVDYLVAPRRGSIALDGEREVELDGSEAVSVRLDLDGPLVLDVRATLDAAVASGALASSAETLARP